MPTSTTRPATFAVERNLAARHFRPDAVGNTGGVKPNYTALLAMGGSGHRTHMRFYYNAMKSGCLICSFLAGTVVLMLVMAALGLPNTVTELLLR